MKGKINSVNIGIMQNGFVSVFIHRDEKECRHYKMHPHLSSAVARHRLVTRAQRMQQALLHAAEKDELHERGRQAARKLIERELGQ